jgi:streptogramin lyase
LPVGRDPQVFAVGFGSVWVANRGDGTLTRLSASDGRSQGPTIRIGGAPGALAITQDAVLVLDTNTGAVLRVDPRSLAAVEIMRIPGYPAAIAVGAGAAWIVDALSGTVTRVTN